MFEHGEVDPEELALEELELEDEELEEALPHEGPEADFLRSVERFFAPIAALPPVKRRGWICGLGHGVLPETPENHVRLFIDLQHELFT